MDIVSPDRRSQMMSRIRGKNTAPELAVRGVAHRLGYRFRLHRRDLPGSPDIVFPKRNAVILVHGCFWHRHLGCRYCYAPKSNTDFWKKKFDSNVARDRNIVQKLEQIGWRILVVWECETKDEDGLRRKLEAYLGT